MDILGYVIVKVGPNFELRPSEYSDDWAYRAQSMDAVIEYLRTNGYPAAPLRIPFIIEMY